MLTRFRGVRWRTTAAATLAVAVFLAVAALMFAFAQRQQLQGSITEAAQQQATDIAAQVVRDGAGADLAAGAGTSPWCRSSTQTGTFSLPALR
jgi:hypothetical protein